MTRVMTGDLSKELEQLLQICRDMKQVVPDVEVSHHKPGCGCPWKINEETGLFDLLRHRVSRLIGDTKYAVYDSDYPFFICAECRNLVPWCFGCDNDDPYLTACCDGCWGVLTKEQEHGSDDNA